MRDRTDGNSKGVAKRGKDERVREESGWFAHCNGGRRKTRVSRVRPVGTPSGPASKRRVDPFASTAGDRPRRQKLMMKGWEVEAAFPKPRIPGFFALDRHSFALDRHSAEA